MPVWSGLTGSPRLAAPSLTASVSVASASGHVADREARRVTLGETSAGPVLSHDVGGVALGGGTRAGSLTSTGASHSVPKTLTTGTGGSPATTGVQQSATSFSTATTETVEATSSGMVPAMQTLSSVLATALPMSLMTPLPRILAFTGGQEQVFTEWHEHFENVAKLAG